MSWKSFSNHKPLRWDICLRMAPCTFKWKWMIPCPKLKYLSTKTGSYGPDVMYSQGLLQRSWGTQRQTHFMDPQNGERLLEPQPRHDLFHAESLTTPYLALRAVTRLIPCEPALVFVCSVCSELFRGSFNVSTFFPIAAIFFLVSFALI